ncbi:MAG: hypothetical protein PVJ09_05470 [Candidatus Woesebacteria bacterium]|jgi:ribosomal protein L32
MGAVPKNKITRVERGKRRSGNKPTLNKQTIKKNSVPLHKRGLIAQIKKAVGLDQVAK